MRGRRNRVRRMWAAGLAALLWCLPGCGAQAGPGQPAQSPPPARVEPGGAEAQAGEIVYEGQAVPLTEEQEGLIHAYMAAAYGALEGLEEPDFSALFADPVQAQANQWAVRVQIGLRTMIPGVDYSLTGWSYTLTCRETVWREDGGLEVHAEESSVQNFAQLPGVDARRAGDEHVFVLEETGTGWRLRSHGGYDLLYTQLVEQVGEEEAPRVYIQAAPEYLSQLRLAWAAREEERGEAAGLPRAETPYDREGALAYADRYAMGRNPAWPDYSEYGGNCQNFASQCLLAGGIPMDTVGPDIWKWYGPDPSENTRAEGRSPSWSGVNRFRQYAGENRGFGLAALVDAPYYSGQPGDLIQMGTQEGLCHTVVLRSLVAGGAGQTVDYLVHSNTSDMENYPASLCGYPVFSLVRIAGWNQG